MQGFDLVTLGSAVNHVKWQTVETLIRCHILCNLIWVCTACRLPFWGSPNQNKLNIAKQRMTFWNILIFDLIYWEFNCLVNTVKVMSSWSVNLLILFLCRLSALSYQYFVHIFLPETDNCSPWISWWENIHTNYFMTNLHKRYVVELSWTCNHWIWSQTCPRLGYGAQLLKQLFLFSYNMVLGILCEVYPNGISNKMLKPSLTFYTIMKTRLFKYIVNFTTKNWKFSDKNSNEYPQYMFLSRKKKNNVYPCKP